MQKLLEILCDKDDPRQHVQTPWHVNGYSYSTNGSVLLRVKGQYGKADTEGKFPKMDEFFFEAKGRGVGLDIKKFNQNKLQYPCNECSPDHPTTRQSCKECNGEGWVEFSSGFNNYDFECKGCHGDGYTGIVNRKDCDECLGTGIELNHRARWQFGERWYSMSLLDYLNSHLPNVKFYPDANPCKDALLFQFDGGDGIIMRLNV